MKPGSVNHLRIVLALLIFTLFLGLLGPLGRAGRSASVLAAAPVTPTRQGTLQPADSDTFTNLQPITVPDFGAAALYPSTIEVSGLTGVTSTITVGLGHITHPNPDPAQAAPAMAL